MFANCGEEGDALFKQLGARHYGSTRSGAEATLGSPAARQARTTTQYVHSGDNRLLSTTDANGGTRQWSYDAAGLVTGPTDARGDGQQEAATPAASSLCRAKF